MQKRLGLFLSLLISQASFAQSITVPIHPTLKDNAPLGTVELTDSPYGLLIYSKLKLPPGQYGMHIHENPSCNDAGLAAGSHFDPQKNHAHLGPYHPNGHLGDLPILTINKNGVSTVTLAPKIKVSKIKNRALIIHEGGDNYADNPKPLGGGGGRMACGIIKEVPHV